MCGITTRTGLPRTLFQSKSSSGKRAWTLSISASSISRYLVSMTMADPLRFRGGLRLRLLLWFDGGDPCGNFGNGPTMSIVQVERYGITEYCFLSALRACAGGGVQFGPNSRWHTL